MPELSPQQKKKLERARLITPNTDLGMFATMQDIAESLDKLAGAGTLRIEGKKGEKGDKGDKGDAGKDGRDGKDGKDGVNGKDGKDGKDGAMGMIDEATIGYLENKIEQLKERVNSFEERIKNMRSGGTSAIGVAQTFKWIAHTEAPTGLINGSNTTYTVKNNIWWIAGFTLNGEQIAQLPNFTYAGRTITFATALPADYSGSDFEIKYIGT